MSLEDLRLIYQDYIAVTDELGITARMIVERLRSAPEVHSIKYRLKTPSQVLTKTVRKRAQDSSRVITVDTFKSELTDLIGIRVLHLHKEGWRPILEFITHHWETHETPVAYVREGDSSKIFSDLSCRVEPSARHYRSVHYVIKCPVDAKGKKVHLVEIQVRTLFEEGWSEIDHRLSYSLAKGTGEAEPLITHFLGVANRLAGSMDEMISSVLMLQDHLVESEKVKSEREDTILKLQHEVSRIGGKIPDQFQVALPVSLRELYSYQSSSIGYPFAPSQVRLIFTTGARPSHHDMFCGAKAIIMSLREFDFLTTRGMIPLAVLSLMPVIKSRSASLVNPRRGLTSHYKGHKGELI